MGDDELVSEALRLDLLRWLREEGRPTEGVEVLATVPLLSAGEGPAYGGRLWRDTAGEAHVLAAWNTDEALRVLEARADGYERLARRSRAFVERARAELGNGG